MIHQTEMVIGVSIPGPVDFDRAGRLSGISIAQVRGDAVILALELLDRIEGEPLPVKPEIAEFNPPPAISNNGKPEPASSKWMRTGPFS
jgi:hypothetical protein